MTTTLGCDSASFTGCEVADLFADVARGGRAALIADALDVIARSAPR